MSWYLAFLPIACLLFMWYNKIEFYSKRKKEYKLKASVVRFVKEKSPMRNDFTLIPYAYVRIEGRKEKLVRLKYSDSWSMPYKVGDQVDVFFYAGVLYYWDAYDVGLSKYLPSKWDFWNAE